jgi:hypothetical protein
VRALVIAAGIVLVASAAAGDPPPDAVLAELPFLPAAPNQVKVDLGTEGGRPLPLLLQTEQLQSFATAGGAREIGLTVRRNKQSPYRRETRLGRDLELYVDTRRSDTASAAGGDYALVAAPFLSRYVLEIDFPGRRVRFLDPDRYRVPERDPSAAVLALRGGNQPIVEIEVGATRLPAVLATGAPGTLILPGGWLAPATRVRLDPRTTATLELPASGGPMEAAVAEQVRLGPFEESEVPMLVAKEGIWSQGPRSPALLGVDFLKRFVLRIDYARGRVWLRDPDGAPPLSSGP